jgi:DNA-binding MarR family transcriptional regulator
MAIHYGPLLRILHWCTDQTMTHALEAMELTSAQGRIMGFLAHRKEPPCPKDIEEEFQLSHPTVSGLLSRLEKKDFIEILPDEQDRRCKRICLRPKGWECMENMDQVIRSNEIRLVADFTEEEQALFADFLKRAITNMGGNPCRRPTHKEDEET